MDIYFKTEGVIVLQNMDPMIPVVFIYLLAKKYGCVFPLFPTPNTTMGELYKIVHNKGAFKLQTMHQSPFTCKAALFTTVSGRIPNLPFINLKIELLATKTLYQKNANDGVIFY